MCGELSSFSEMCGTIVLNYRNEIYNSIKDGFTKRNVCMLSGMCSEAFHPHAVGYEVRILNNNNNKKKFPIIIFICRNLRML